MQAITRVASVSANPIGLKYTVASKSMWFEISEETTVGSLWETMWTEASSQQSVGLPVSENLMLINGLFK